MRCRGFGSVDISVAGCGYCEYPYPLKKIIQMRKSLCSNKIIGQRSDILQAANKVIKNNTNRKPKNLWTETPTGPKLFITMRTVSKRKAQFVAGKIKELMTGGKRSYSRYCDYYTERMPSLVSSRKCF